MSSGLIENAQLVTGMLNYARMKNKHTTIQPLFHGRLSASRGGK
jgi:hypothetical protein